MKEIIKEIFKTLYTLVYISAFMYVVYVACQSEPTNSQLATSICCAMMVFCYKIDMLKDNK
jgi:Trk-type K+ transport system membrane component